LVGPWRSGKSTLPTHLKEKLVHDGEWQIARFNPSPYSSLEAATPKFFSKLTAALPPESNGKDHRKAIGD
jgi:predicted KAP-like P-loop ATPase